MKTMIRVLGALAVIASAAPAALADEPCDPPGTTYVEPSGYGYAPEYAPQPYAPQYAPAPAPVVVQPSYAYGNGWRARMWEARRAELRRERMEAYRRWLWHERMEHRGHYRGRF